MEMLLAISKALAPLAPGELAINSMAFLEKPYPKFLHQSKTFLKLADNFHCALP
jgi:hypothetical protein